MPDDELFATEQDETSAAAANADAAADAGDGQAAGPDRGATTNEALPDWAASLPESLRGLAARAGDLPGLEAALKHGLTHRPISKPEEAEIPLPAGVDAAQANTGWFRDLAVQQGFSKGQIKALAEAYNRELEAVPARMMAAAERTLRAEYGEEYEARIAKARDAARRFDRMCGGADEAPGPFARILDLGLGNHPDFIRCMAAIGEAVSDSAMPGVSSGGGGAQAVSTEEFLNSVMSEK